MNLALAMTRSAMIPEVAASVKESDELNNRKRRSENAPDRARDQTYKTKALACAHGRTKEATALPINELDCCKKIMNKDHCCSKKRKSETVQKFVDQKDVDERDNVAMKMTGIQHAPLIQGKVQLGNVHNDQQELLIEECYLRAVIIDPKEKRTTIKKELI